MCGIGCDIEQLLPVIRPDTACFLREVQPRGVPGVADSGRPVHLAAAHVEERDRENGFRPLLQLTEIEDRGHEGKLCRARQNGKCNSRAMRADGIGRQNGMSTGRPARINHHRYLKLAVQAGRYNIARRLITQLVR